MKIPDPEAGVIPLKTVVVPLGVFRPFPVAGPASPGTVRDPKTKKGGK